MAIKSQDGLGSIVALSAFAITVTAVAALTGGLDHSQHGSLGDTISNDMVEVHPVDMREVASDNGVAFELMIKNPSTSDALDLANTSFTLNTDARRSFHPKGVSLASSGYQKNINDLELQPHEDATVTVLFAVDDDVEPKSLEIAGDAFGAGFYIKPQPPQ